MVLAITLLPHTSAATPRVAIDQAGLDSVIDYCLRHRTRQVLAPLPPHELYRWLYTPTVANHLELPILIDCQQHTVTQMGRHATEPELLLLINLILGNDGRSVLNPRVIFEVLSPTTEVNDRTTKLDNYLEIQTLTDYVLVAQDTPRILHVQRLDDGSWIYRVITGLEAVVKLESIDCELPLTAIYRGYDDPEIVGA